MTTMTKVPQVRRKLVSKLKRTPKPGHAGVISHGRVFGESGKPLRLGERVILEVVGVERNSTTHGHKQKYATPHRMAKEPICLVPDKKMEGKFVALRSFLNREVVASGESAGVVIAEANRQGVESPLVFYVPKAGED